MEECLKLACLPKHLIINKIEPYTRKVIGRDLSRDIIDFRSIRKLHAIYNFGLMSNLRQERRTHNDIYTTNTLVVVRMSWFFIEMDMLAFLIRSNLISHIYNRVYNNDDGTLHYIPHISFDTETIDSLIDTEFNIVKNHVRRIWGLLTPEERHAFIHDEVLNE